ncbi:MAG: Rieske (2Fe-2S) protein [Pseudomonadales bacterium]|nr:Rieske (2Fe-2S) protein [Pseudomonadales bacterium]
MLKTSVTDMLIASSNDEASELAEDNYKPSHPNPRYPKGWYSLCSSSDLNNKKPLPLSYFGKELAAFRDENGRACVSDAICPHYGANLARGGKVVNGEIQCPLHEWRFDGKGKCSHVPFAQGTPSSERSRLNMYPVQEINGLVFVWYHPQKSAPEYDIPAFEEASGKGWLKMKNFRMKFRSHVQEMRENFCDESHFSVIHGQPKPASLQWQAEGAFAKVTSSVYWPLMVALGLGENIIFCCEASMIGPGFMVVKTSGLFTVSAFALTTPIDETWSEMRFYTTAQRVWWLPGMAWYAHRLLRKTAIKDLTVEGAIWNHKQYLEKPIFQAHERSIGKFRKWYQQFYQYNEPAEAITELKQNANKNNPASNNITLLAS